VPAPGELTRTNDYALGVGAAAAQRRAAGRGTVVAVLLGGFNFKFFLLLLNSVIQNFVICICPLMAACITLEGLAAETLEFD
jgi:hypothetical protein